MRPLNVYFFSTSFSMTVKTDLYLVGQPHLLFKRELKERKPCNSTQTTMKHKQLCFATKLV